mgnify:FL=1
MKATAGGRTFESDSWLRLVREVMLVTGARVSRNEGIVAAKQLERGVSAVLTKGVVIKPEGARE